MTRTPTKLWSRGRLMALAVAFAFLVSALAAFGVTVSGVISSAASHAQETPSVRAAQATNQPSDHRVAVIVQKADTSSAAAELVGRLGGRVTKDLSIINAFAAEIPAECICELAASPSVRYVTPDGPVASTAKRAPTATTVTTLATAKTVTTVPIQFTDMLASLNQALPSDIPPNTYLDTLGVSRLAKTIDGRGIGVAVIDTGISKDGDFGTGTVAVQKTFDHFVLTVDDSYGHGTHVAGIIAGNGSDSSGFFRGIAPGVTLIGLKVADEIARASESDVVAAMQWVYENKDRYNIRVVNLSINSSVSGSYHESPLNAAAEILWFSGVVVVASAGNVDPSSGNSVVGAAPANDPFIITVGASDEGGTASRSDDVMAGYSAAGLTKDGLAKPDIIAPGTDIYSVLSGICPWGYVYPERTAFDRQYFRLSGSSMAAPMVTGAVALLLQDEPTLNPDQVKYRLLNSTRTALSARVGGQSVPYLDVYAAVTGTSTASANIGIPASKLLSNGDSPLVWNGVMWNGVMWNSVMWNSVMWNGVMWNSVCWN